MSGSQAPLSISLAPSQVASVASLLINGQRNTMLSESPIQILLVEDNPGDALLFHEALADIHSVHFELTHVCRLGEALQQLENKRIDVILLDLSLPDSQGVDTFFVLHAHHAHIPIIVLTGLADETLALRVVAGGGQDYLFKGQIDGPALVRAIRYAIERHCMQRELQSLSLTDDLTGLHNRRGFFSRASRQIKLAHRHETTMLVVYADVDGLKRTNDTLGHDVGTQLLIDAARTLSATFRESDIISRFGGDEFVILAIDAGQDDEQAVISRLEASIADHNRHGQRPYELSISVGIVPFVPRGDSTLEEAIARADQAMYRQKHSRRRTRDAYEQLVDQTLLAQHYGLPTHTGIEKTDAHTIEANPPADRG
jgi:diguanylate cyclase (GGDEF)-like protein